MTRMTLRTLICVVLCTVQITVALNVAITDAEMYVAGLGEQGLSAFTFTETSLLWKSGHEQLLVQACGANSIRVRSTISGDFVSTLNALMDDSCGSPTARTFSKRVHGGGVVLSDNIQCVVSDQGELTFIRVHDNATLIEEYVPLYGHDVSARDYHPTTGSVSLSFATVDDEQFWGMGQGTHGHLDLHGLSIPLQQFNTHVSIPFVVSSRQYGMLWNTPSVGRVVFGRDRVEWTAEEAPQLDYWITTSTPNNSDNPYADIMSHYVDATGHAPVLPDYASGFWQSKLRYRNQTQVLAVANEYASRNLTLSVVVVDFLHWPQFGDWAFDKNCWPELPALKAQLSKLGVELMVSVWPVVNHASKSYPEMASRGLLARSTSGLSLRSLPNEFASGHLYDPFSSSARRFVWDQCKANYYDTTGVKVFWLDACEPEVSDTVLKAHGLDSFSYAGGLSHSSVGNMYPWMHQRAFHEGMQQAGIADGMMLSRSAWAGSQRFGTAVWSGDIESSFDSLRRQIRAGLNIMMSGIPWWTTDIGGFSGGHNNDPEFRELIVRWFQYGAFCPLFRLHGDRLPNDPDSPTCGESGGPNEVWSFGETAYGIIKDVMALREDLRPYIKEQMVAASQHGTPPMRPLFFDFVKDNHAYQVEDQFMFGPKYLVAPVTEYQQQSKRVYLPLKDAGTQWMHYYTKTTYAGGVWVDVETPLHTFPLFVLIA